MASRSHHSPPSSSSLRVDRCTKRPALHVPASRAPRRGIGTAREDVHRHNALDEPIGRRAARRQYRGVSCRHRHQSRPDELVQRTAVLRPAVLRGVSAPAALAIREANAHGITLLSMTREGGASTPSRTKPQPLLRHCATGLRSGRQDRPTVHPRRSDLHKFVQAGSAKAQSPYPPHHTSKDRNP